MSGRVLTADTMTAHNTFDAPDTVVPTEFDAVELAGDLLKVRCQQSRLLW